MIIPCNSSYIGRINDKNVMHWNPFKAIHFRNPPTSDIRIISTKFFPYENFYTLPFLCVSVTILCSLRRTKNAGEESFSHFNNLCPSKCFSLFKLSFFQFVSYIQLTVNIVNIQGRYDTCIWNGMTCMSHFWLLYFILLVHEVPCLWSM